MKNIISNINVMEKGTLDCGFIPKEAKYAYI